MTEKDMKKADDKLLRLKDYLEKAKAYNTPKVKAIYMGNETADMDSVIGSIMCAWWYG